MFSSMRLRFQNISDRDVMLLLLGFFVGAVTVSLVAHFNSGTVDMWAWLDGFAQNFGTEMFGAFLTFVLIETLVGGRRRREDEARGVEARKAQLIRQMGVSDNGLACQAVRELEAEGWLHDGALEGVFLIRANLAGADLFGANLERVYLIDANLEGVDLQGANLEGADLMEANLKGARLNGANLEEADLNGANLEGADLHAANLKEAQLIEANLEGVYLSTANLKGANLSDVNLKGARLNGANLEEADLNGANLEGAQLMDVNLYGATLPDGTKWSPDADMELFTDPDGASRRLPF